MCTKTRDHVERRYEDHWGWGNGSEAGLRGRDESVHEGQFSFKQIRCSYSLCFPPVHIARGTCTSYINGPHRPYTCRQCPTGDKVRQRRSLNHPGSAGNSVG